MSDSTSPANACPHCGAPVATGAPEGLCPRCVAALNPDADTAITGAAEVGNKPACEAGIVMQPSQDSNPDPLPNSDSQEDLVLKPLHANPDGIPPVLFWTSIAIRLLKWIELIQLKSAYSRFRKQESTDAWIFVENREAKGPVSFNDILLKLREGQSPLDIIHESKAYDEVPNWSELVYNPVWSRPFAALAWTIGFWITVIGVGFISVNLLLPVGMIRTLGSIVYWLLLLGVAFTRTKPHLRNWFDRIRMQ